MKRKVAKVLIIITILMSSLLVNSSAEIIDTNAEPVPIVTSGSFVCTTWNNTSLDSFNIEGAGVTMTQASWGFDRGYVLYKLSGTFIPGFTISLDIAGTMGEMGYAQDHEGNDLNMHVKCYDLNGKEIQALTKEVKIKKVSSSTLSDTVSIQVPNDVDEVELYGSFTCKWVTPYATASEVVGVKANLKSEKDAEPSPESEPANPETSEPETSGGESWWSRLMGKEGHDLDRNFEWDMQMGGRIVRFGDLHGEVNVKRWDEDEDAYVFCDIDTPLRHGDMIRTLPKSGAILSFSDMSTYVMKEDTVIILDLATESETKIGLVAGNIWANLKKMAKDGSMEVEMSRACAGIKGTTFICEEKDGVSTLKVFEGIVEYTSNVDGKTIMVSGGEMISASSDGLGQLANINIGKELESWDKNVKEMTAQILRDTKRRSPFGWIITIVIIIVIVFIAGASAIFLMKNKRKKVGSYPLVEEPLDMHERRQPSDLNKYAKKYCHNCGRPILENTKFCSSCGQRIL